MDKNSYLRVKKFNKEKYLKTLDLLKAERVNTICLAANCPNRYECFSGNQATFMILGDVCSRNCKYCNVDNKKPSAVDKNEPLNIARAVLKLKLNYVVITSVSRDDLEDKGIEQFVLTVKKIREKKKTCKIELLIPDFKGNQAALGKIIDLKPSVINHNIETTEELFSKLRPQGDYHLSLSLFKKIKNSKSRVKIKSGIMLGLGETSNQLIQTFKDLKKNGVEILTIGQYLSPSSKHAPVKKYYSQKEFLNLKNMALNMGFGKVVSGPLVRSSYKAGKI